MPEHCAIDVPESGRSRHSRRLLSQRVFKRAAAVLLFSVGTFGTCRVIAQENPERLDSIIQLLDRQKKDTLQIAMLIMAAESWYTSPNAFPYLHRLDTLSTELLRDPSPRVRAKARHARGAYHFFIGYHAKFERNIPLALSSLEQAIEHFSDGGHHHAVGECHDALGLVLQLAGENGEAEEHFREELRIARAIKHAGLLNQSLIHLARVAGDRGKWEMAAAYLDSCGTGPPGDSALVLVERARILGGQGRQEEQQRNLQAALSAGGRSQNPWDQLPAYTPLVRLLYARERFEEGRANAQACATLAARMGDRVAECTCIMLEGDGAYLMGASRTAEARWLAGMELAERNGTIGVARELGDEGSMLHAAAKLKELYAEQGRTADALRYTQLWAELSDSVRQMDGRSEVLLLQYREQRALDSLTHEQSLLRSQLEHQGQLADERLQRYAVLGIATVTVLVLLGLWSRSRYRERANRRIIEAHEKLMESERQRENEAVRTRIARDLHDEMGGELTKIGLLSSEARRQLPTQLGTLHETLARIAELSRSAHGALHDVVHATDASTDSSAALVEHARTIAHRLLDHSTVQHTIDVEHIGAEVPVGPATKRDLLMILKEAINNALKHAQAERIDVVFRVEDGHFRLEVADDGKGFDPAQAKGGGNGLRNMKARAKGIGAALVINSSPTGGSRTSLTL
ncbi:MAG TPA: ATP-binding protein [Flavobacteriales bacterium]|nr:ATP-binding protein [Flavobacteriales bacterium]